MNILLFILAFFFAVPSALAVSLSGRSSDDSVCDLTPSTSYNLSKNVLFVEAGTFDEAEIYQRIALRFITSRCRDGQVLLMHSDFGDGLDDRFFRGVAGQVCSMAQVQRESTATSEAPSSFQIRCPIRRIKDAAAYLASSERTKTTEAMIAEGAPRHRSEDSNETAPRKDCKGKLSFGQVILGMGGRCTQE
jgi:hypothetical protein